VRACASLESREAPCLEGELKVYDLRKELKEGFWRAALKVYFDEPCEALCLGGGPTSIVLFAASMLRRDEACVLLEGQRFNLKGLWTIMQLNEPLRTVALYVVARGEASPKDVVEEIGERIGLTKSQKSLKLAWSYLNELEKKGIVVKVSRGRYSPREELFWCPDNQ